MKSPKKLTAKQCMITQALADDYNIPEAAVHLNMKEDALERLVERAKDRLGVKNAAGLVAEAIRNHCIDVFKTKKRDR